jgi:hypothetical protein
MQKANLDLYELIRARGLRLWWVAYELGIQDSNFARMMRRELPTEKRTAVIAAIEKLTQEAE